MNSLETIKMWAVDTDSRIVSIQATSDMDSERLLEDALTSRPDLLLPGLKLVGRQTPTATGWLDLLGVDEDGRLVVFELKKGTLSRDAVSQVIDYASSLNSMDMSGLTDHIAQHSGMNGIEEIDIGDWYGEAFPGKALTELLPPRMFLVGLGADEPTERMVRFLAEQGSDISLLTFYGFAYDGKTLLARHVEVEGSAGAESSTVRRRSRSDMVNEFNARTGDLGVIGLIETVRQMFTQTSRDIFQGRYSPAYESTGVSRTTFSLLERADSGNMSYRAYFSISMDPEPGKVQINFYARAIELCLDAFERLTQQDPFTKRTPSYAGSTGQVQWDILLPMNSQADWETHKEKLTALTQAVYEAWLNRERDNESDSE